jgi:hypothetical protein
MRIREWEYPTISYVYNKIGRPVNGSIAGAVVVVKRETSKVAD